MSTVRLDEKKDLYRMIRGLSDDSFEKAVNYVEYLRYIEEQEDKEEDMRLRGFGDLESTRQRSRSEERRVGKECRSRWSPYH